MATSSRVSNTNSIKDQSKEIIVREYLKQQASMLVQSNGSSEHDFADTLIREGQINLHHKEGLNRYPPNENNEQLTEFKEQVKHWLRLDSEINAISSKIKMLDNERKHRKKIMNDLSGKILRFMSTNEIDELNSKDGIIQYKKSYIKPPLTHKKIIADLKNQFQNNEDAVEKINSVFQNREKYEKITLKRS